MVEGGPELVELFLADALGVAGQDLVLHLVDGSGDGGEQLLPAHADVLQRWRKIHFKAKKREAEAHLVVTAEVKSTVPPWCSWCACCRR